MWKYSNKIIEDLLEW